MITKIKINKCDTDFKTLEDLDFKDGFTLAVYSDTHDLLHYKYNKEPIDKPIFGIWVEIGHDQYKSIMTDVPMDDLELFANSILKSIEIIRNNYSEQIKTQLSIGGIV